MTLKLAASNPDPEPSAAGQGPRILAPGAPPSPGPVPNELAQHLSFGEALVWWNAKDRIDVGPVGLVLLAVLVILGFVTLFAPEFWSQPWSELAKPIAALLSPAALVLLRERLDQCSVLVTDAAIVGVDRGGHAVRLGLQGIASVRRDLLRGGLVLAGRDGRVRIPPSLLDDARQAIASQQRNRVRGSSTIDDPMGWLP
ncbi:MAG: hypothetical protein H6712_17055 [Myxococcales bacterium]|nr:hypothetical protein [Myxococcales bacterium]MCB9715580.1 hypothetical protein [Myxococcales bacterium]